MRYVVSATLICVGIIHLLPVSGALSETRLAALYGLQFSDPNLEILMRHRAVLFGLFGGFLIYAAFHTALQPIAFVAGFVSVASFLYLCWSVGGHNAAIGRVCTADVVALVCLVIGAAARAYLLREA